MRRILTWVLLAGFLAQSSAAPAFAANGQGVAGVPELGADLIASFAPLRIAFQESKLYAQFTGQEDRYTAIHMPPPLVNKPARAHSMGDWIKTVHPQPWHRVARAEGRTDHVIIPRRPDPRERILDPLAEERNFARPGHGSGLAPRSFVRVPSARVPEMSPQAASTAAPLDAGTGINHWWSYEERPIAGLGKAMINVSNGNMLVQTTDVDIPERGIDLAFQRTWNSQSLHDINGDDGGDPSIYGNRWTNTFDAHLVFRKGNPNVITVYDIDGTRYDYTADGLGGWVPPPGVYGTLIPQGSINGCDYWWTKKSGTSYYFHAPTNSLGNCSIAQGKIGQLYEIAARNSNNNIQFTYTWAGGSQTSQENITQIQATHSDGDTLILTFGAFGSANELSQITLPDGTAIYYHYESNGDLYQAFKPTTITAAMPPDPFGDVIPPGTAPELYETVGNNTWTSFCGPRGTIALYFYDKNTANGLTDGDCAEFFLDSNGRATQWQDQAIGNFTPGSAPWNAVLQPQLPTATNGQWMITDQAWLSYATTPTTKTTFTDSNGHERVWTYDAYGRVTQTQEWAGATAATALVTSATWGAPANATPAQAASANNLLSETDPAGNTTKYAYDPNGNTIEVALPPPAGGARPVSTYSYDYNPNSTPSSNNLVKACDANYNALNGTTSFTSSTSDSLCPGGAGTTRMTYTPTTAEPFGELTQIQTPCVGDSCRSPGNTVTIAYATGPQNCGGGLDCGLPTSVTGATASQPNGQTYAPSQSFVYTGRGMLSQYNTGVGTWNLTYDTLNRPLLRTDPDGYTSKNTYNVDGSVQETQTPYQLGLGLGVSYTYDADGNALTETHYKGGTYNATAGGSPSLPGAAVTHKYYDGLDRLVEVDQPNDGLDIYSTPWVTRYIYDLSQPAASPATGYAAPAIADVTVPIVAYGNLYKTQEWLPSNTVVSWNGASQLTGTSFQDINGTAFDALDRPTSKFKYTYVGTGGGTEAISQEILNYDGSPDSQGHLYHDEEPGGTGVPPQNYNCAQTSIECKTYTYDGVGRVSNISFTIAGTNDPNTPQRTMTYDGDGHTLTVVQGQPSSPIDSETYLYDADGREQKDTNGDGAYFINDFYPDGKRAALSTLIAADTFQYSYANDGNLKRLDFSMPSVGHSGSLIYGLTAAGRVAQRTDSADSGSNMVTTYQRAAAAYGQVTEVDYPSGSHSNMEYDPDGDLLGQIVYAPSAPAFTGGLTNFTQTCGVDPIPWTLSSLQRRSPTWQSVPPTRRSSGVES